MGVQVLIRTPSVWALVPSQGIVVGRPGGLPSSVRIEPQADFLNSLSEAVALFRRGRVPHNLSIGSCGFRSEQLHGVRQTIRPWRKPLLKQRAVSLQREAK